MSKLKDKRYEVIRRITINHGIEFGDKIFISLWDLAMNINNLWEARNFVAKNKREKIGKYYRGIGTRYVVNSWSLFELFPAIRHGVKDTDIELRESYNNKSEYLIISND